jgi:hypothetical protein
MPNESSTSPGKTKEHNGGLELVALASTTISTSCHTVSNTLEPDKVRLKSCSPTLDGT